jgi:uncharacterized protein
MRILISGSTGLVGSALLETLQNQGHDAARLARPGTQRDLRTTHPSPGQRNVLWDPVAGILDSGAEGADVVVHLAGASIAGGRWTAARKRLLRDSRIAATRHLVDALARLRRPPQLFVAASAIGYYGSRGEEELTEASSPGTDFLAHLTRSWEAESARAAEFGARVVTPRFGMILSRHGGALPRMVLPFRLGIGGRIGSGRQWMSWIALEDAVGIVCFAMTTNLLSGAANAVAPNPVRNIDFVSALARVLHRPALLPVPAFALRLAFGEMADALLLASQHVFPGKLDQLGYHFAQPELGPALASLFDPSP